MAILEFKDVSYTHNEKNILENISIEIDLGDFISIVGHSGSGKSTFLKLCSDLITPTDGYIKYKDKYFSDYDPIELRKNIAYCFQTPYLFGDTVMDNISFAYSIRGKKIDLDRVNKLFSMFNLNEDYLEKEVLNLSGGEKQRISIIRSLLFNPEVLLLDEVTSALDVDNTLVVESVINSLNEKGTTILWVTHNIEQSRKYANKVLTIDTGKIKSLEVIA
jgi:putative ABC transport system ATP-binding protein